MDKNPAEIPDVLLPTYMVKSLRAMKSPRAVERITFDKSEANPGETLYISMPKLNDNEVQEAKHGNNFLVQNVTWALVDKLVMKFVAATLQDTVGYDIYKTFEDLFLPVRKRDSMVQKGIQSKDLCKIRSNAGDNVGRRR